MIYIPIGEDCFSTKYLNKHGLRTFATIFDWVIICPEDILRLFKNDFQDFLLKENLQFLRKSRVRFRHKDIDVMETNYNILIPHHFNSIEKDYQHVHDKFMYRIEKLKNILNTEDEIIFVYRQIKETKKAKNFIYSYTGEQKKKFGKKNMMNIEKELVNYIWNKYNTKLKIQYI